MSHKLRLNLFWTLVVFYLVVYYGGLVLLFPLVSQWAAGVPQSLPMPSAALGMYRMLILLGLFVYVASSHSRRQAFLVPLFRFMGASRQGWRVKARGAVLVVLPLAVGGIFLVDGLPRLITPTSVRIQHPTMPGKFEKLHSPFRDPDKQAVAAFKAELAKAAESAADAPAKRNPPSDEEARAALVKKWTREGASLYAVNCRPCHGMQANGAGPMARGFRLKPANFQDPGLLPTVVESYAFWRISKGGPGLPAASTPWDSAMPIWELDLSEKTRWKILLGEYFLSGVGPRKTE